jgi:ribokinase
VEPADLLAFGDLSVDSIAAVERFPVADDKLWVERRGDFAGGMVGNFACVAAALGVRSAVVALLGNDAHGDLVLEDLRRHGVDAGYVRRVDAPTFLTLSLTTPTGERALLQFPTAAFGTNWDGFDRSVLASTAWVHTTAEQGDRVEGLLADARAAGASTSLDVEYPFVKRVDLDRLAAKCDVVFMNRAAADSLGGGDEAARRLRRSGAEVVVVTRGEDGCVVAADGAVHEIAAVRLGAVDANGAGDAFAAAFVVARMRGWRAVHAAEFANVVGALTTTALGGHGAELSERVVGDAARAAGFEWTVPSA